MSVGSPTTARRSYPRQWWRPVWSEWSEWKSKRAIELLEKNTLTIKNEIEAVSTAWEGELNQIRDVALQNIERVNDIILANLMDIESTFNEILVDTYEYINSIDNDRVIMTDTLLNLEQCSESSVIREEVALVKEIEKDIFELAHILDGSLARPQDVLELNEDDRIDSYEMDVAVQDIVIDALAKAAASLLDTDRPTLEQSVLDPILDDSKSSDRYPTGTQNDNDSIAHDSHGVPCVTEAFQRDTEANERKMSVGVILSFVQSIRRSFRLAHSRVLKVHVRAQKRANERRIKRMQANERRWKDKQTRIRNKKGRFTKKGRLRRISSAMVQTLRRPFKRIPRPINQESQKLFIEARYRIHAQVRERMERSSPMGSDPGARAMVAYLAEESL